MLKSTRSFHPTLGAFKEWALEEEKAVDEFMNKCRESLVENGVPGDAVTIAVRGKAARNRP